MAVLLVVADFCGFSGICGTCFLDFCVILGFGGHPEIGTAIAKCFELWDDEKHVLDPGQLYP